MGVLAFEKAPYEEFAKYLRELPGMTEDRIEECYKNIRVPKKLDMPILDYEVYSPCDFTVSSEEEELRIPTGIRFFENSDCTAHNLLAPLDLLQECFERMEVEQYDCVEGGHMIALISRVEGKGSEPAIEFKTGDVLGNLILSHKNTGINSDENISEYEKALRDVAELMGLEAINA